MREPLNTFIDFPSLDPVRAHERTTYGWRGLTEVGEVLEVKGTNGHALEIPSEIVMSAQGQPTSRHEVRNDWNVDIDAYLQHFNAAVANYKANNLPQALVESDATLQLAPTLRAKFNRAMILLASGRWTEGFDQYWKCEQQAPFMRSQVRQLIDLGLHPWMGQDINGHRLVLVHAHGFGDTLMTLRYVPQLRANGIDAVMVVPSALRSLAEQCGPVETSELSQDDFFCPMLHLLYFLQVTPALVVGSPYLNVAEKPQAWSRCEQLGRQEGTPAPRRRRVGVAWSVGKPSNGDYPREIPLPELVAALGDVEIHSMQTQGVLQAQMLGVHVHDFADFADCASLMQSMDAIVSVDTSALHLAGAIGHPHVFGLLSHWHSWRWVAPWYDNVRLCRQTADGDWSSALAQIQYD
jgi:hypothetical protein